MALLTILFTIKFITNYNSPTTQNFNQPITHIIPISTNKQKYQTKAETITADMKATSAYRVIRLQRAEARQLGKKIKRETAAKEKAAQK